MKSLTSPSLSQFLRQSNTEPAICEAIVAMAQASGKIAELLRHELSDSKSATATGANNSGDSQKQLDLVADQIVEAALRASSVKYYASEEQSELLSLGAEKSGELVMAVDPLDGSSNIETNGVIGTIFSLRRDRDSLYGNGDQQLAAGFVVYGPRTRMIFTTNHGSHIAGYDCVAGEFVMIATEIKIPNGNREYAINSSNYHHWQPRQQQLFDQWQLGSAGAFAASYNMRWTGSLVADAYRIFKRGGVFLYLEDRRKGYENGRLRLLYEVHPIALVVEQAGGMATTQSERILNRVVTELHQRSPLCFGEKQEMERIVQFLKDN